MAIRFTPAQQKVLDARNHNILVSAAAGSGKTAVLVERIVRLITEGENPLDIDRLLVVTFTRAAASQMRERIGQALSARLRENPGSTHLQKQEVLLHNAQITTMDSFFTFLLRNYFSDIDLDPGFRQIDPTESRLIAAEVLQDFLEEKYAEKDPAFMRCVSFFCSGLGDREMEKLLTSLCDQAGSHPSPEDWLRERASDYDVPDEEALFETPWMRSAVLRLCDLLLESDAQYAAMENICLQPDGPDVLYSFLEEERQSHFAGIRKLCEDKEAPASACMGESGEGGAPGSPDSAFLRLLWEEIRGALAGDFRRYPVLRGKKYDYIDDSLKDAVKSMRDAEKTRIQRLSKQFGGQSAGTILAMMDFVKEPVRTLSNLAIEYRRRFLDAKKERHCIDFVDLEHFALAILAERQPDGSYLPRRAAKALRSHYAEILIDEYQDSNEVQELLLWIISGEDEDRYNRFMVGDIKQSIYRFRLARPEIFLEKYETYRPDDPRTERIELDQNFRSRGEVLDCVNMLFMRIMRREIGGVEYNDSVSLKKGAVFPGEEAGAEGGTESGIESGIEAGNGRRSPYCAELLLLETDNPDLSGETGGDSAGPDSSDPDTGDFSEGKDFSEENGEQTAVLPNEIRSMSARQKEALLIAGRIRELVGTLPVRDEETGLLRPARYGDIVILLRSTMGWNEDLRAVLAREGIPAYAESRTGYFAAEEIRVVLAMLRVLDNPRQDIPLYSALRAYFGDFTQDEIAQIRLAERDGALYDALCAAAGSGAEEEPAESAPAQEISPSLSEKCRNFLSFLEKWRERTRYASVAEVVAGLLEETGYRDYCAALPGGAQRVANLSVLRSQAEAFTKTEFTGLFQFMRYIDGLVSQEIDYGEANTLDENADVVRIMSIHKSKGLEFPICFVAGLSKGFAFRSFDASGMMLFDSDWGVGVHYYDPASRVRASTLRREEIAEKIRRDCMGEELRVLYVALTRAKEKLILTASGRNLSGKIRNWESRLAGFFQRRQESAELSGGQESRTEKLPSSVIGGASSFAELICEAAMAGAGAEEMQELFLSADQGAREGSISILPNDKNPRFPLVIRMLSEEDLSMRAVREQYDLSRCEELLRGMEGRPLAAQPDPGAAQELASRFFSVYPHEELRGLYAHTSVSEIKHRAFRAEAPASGDADGAVPGEGPAELFPEEIPVPYIPRFQRRLTEDAALLETASGKTAKGARRGTAFHRVLECMDYAKRDIFLMTEQERQVAADGGRERAKSDGGKERAEADGGRKHATADGGRERAEAVGGRERAEAGKDAALADWIRSLVDAGKIPAEDAALVNLNRLRAFLRSPLAARMAAADGRGMLFREHPFLMGVPADRVRSDLPSGETVTVQGIIDAFFVEDEQIILIDYKTDRVKTDEDLLLRYRTQLEIYAEALERAFSLPVTEKIIYSIYLEREIRL